MRHMQAVYSVYLIFYDGAEDEASEMVRSWIDHQPINIFDYKCIDAASLGCGCYGKTSERIP
ncbi:predicted protein [Sclerotinia sclerotiorum 1980 UF-70]|uniref:Uncharacterized protein n=1 Tax=Sclerotinia sclerotiorum (strain ATCC 18683 / 1980 / Ss-1) TaxID=665079 RepID=A7EMB1_SCLS1|nr:predicted protein [Sclerotinia sclerotiorum 1980 UF-70]EDO03977.1 predicted protein [Sclerotinia sclerotiorum 1980 UF-70]